MALHLEKIVKDFIKPKNIELSSFGWKEVVAIERVAKSMTAPEIIAELKHIERLRLGLSGDDFKDLEKKIGRAL